MTIERRDNYLPPRHLTEETRVLERESFVLHHTIKGAHYADIAAEYNTRWTEPDEERYKVKPSTVKLDRVRALKRLKEENREMAGLYQTMLIEQADFVIGTLTARVEGGHLGAVDRYLSALRFKADLTGSYAPSKHAQTDSAGNDLHMNATERADLAQKILDHAAQRRQLLADQSEAHIIDAHTTSDTLD